MAGASCAARYRMTDADFGKLIIAVVEPPPICTGQPIYAIRYRLLNKLAAGAKEFKYHCGWMMRSPAGHGACFIHAISRTDRWTR